VLGTIVMDVGATESFTEADMPYVEIPPGPTALT